MNERRIDVFNGDADGLCALRQLRLDDPREAERVTGLKREIDLLSRVTIAAGERPRITVLDVSFDRNRDDALRLLAAGAFLRYFDHHFTGDLPVHANLDAHIDTSPATCTSVIVDRHLHGRFRPWAVVGAFGDNLPKTAEGLAATIGLPAERVARLRELGECLNYNGYGETEADVAIHPRDLYLRLVRYADPYAFTVEDHLFDALVAQRAKDLAQAAAVGAAEASSTCAVHILPDAPWSRRVLGTFANDLAGRAPTRAHAVLKVNSDGTYAVSLRAPVAWPRGAGALCRAFPGGGGREGAGGLDRLPQALLEPFLAAVRAAEWTGPVRRPRG
jgi:hypothetical protein